MDELISFLNSMHPVSGSLEADVRERFRFTKKKKNEFLLHEGEVCCYAWYLQKGLVRCYYTRDEREVTMWFLEEDHVIVLSESLFHQKKSLFNLQAIEDCGRCSCSAKKFRPIGCRKYWRTFRRCWWTMRTWNAKRRPRL